MVTEAIKPGYQKTEVGIIPNDWDVKELCDVGIFKKGKGIRKEEVRSEGLPCIRYGEIYTHYNNYVRKFFSFISKETSETSQLIKEGDLLFAGSGETAEEIGKCVAFVGKGKAFAGGDIVILSPQEGDSIYFGYLMNHKTSIIQKSRLAQGDAVVHIYGKHLSKVEIPYPPVEEQQAIAQVLSETDELIEQLDKLILKKKNLKQGAMQELLTGKKRLPGFSGEWEEKELGSIGEVSGAGVDKKIISGETPVRLVNFLDVYHKDFIYSEMLNHWVTTPTHKAVRCAVKKRDIFFTPSSEMREDIGFSAVAMEDIADATYSYHVVRFRLNEEWDIKFSSYIFNERFFLNQAETVCEGSGKRYVINMGKFRQLKIRYPKNTKEQEVIGKILFDMDSEIEELEQERDKYTLIKIGMMQQLLTGSIRLK